jgi:hypothetical protein
VPFLLGIGLHIFLQNQSEKVTRRNSLYKGVSFSEALLQLFCRMFIAIVWPREQKQEFIANSFSRENNSKDSLPLPIVFASKTTNKFTAIKFLNICACSTASQSSD